MADATTEFFRELGERGRDPRLSKVTGSVRFELANGQRKARWLVTIDRGTIAVSRANTRADCVVRTTKQVFDEIAAGETNAFAAVLRGVLTVEGAAELLIFFQRLFPGRPPQAA